jgi:hypothetical protein
MQSALRRAGLSAAQINYVNAHGTGTRDNDVAEGNALKTVFGERLPPLSSTKRFFGHSLAASGAIEAVICLEALRRQELPPNSGFEVVDPAIGIVPVTRLERAELTHVMSNSFGFGGNNAVLIFSTPKTRGQTRVPEKIQATIRSIGLIGPGIRGEHEMKPPLSRQNIAGLSCGALPDVALLSPNQRRRLGRLIQMALIAARRCHNPEPGKRIAVAIGTGLGCLEDAEAFIENLIAKEEREPMPARFPNSVHNALASQVAIDQKATGLNSAPTMGEISFECGLWQVLNQLAIGEADLVLAGAADELNDYTLTMGKVLPGEGAMVASLARTDSKGEKLGTIATVRLGRYRRPYNPEAELDWIASAVDLQTIDVLLTGAHGAIALEPAYQQFLTAAIKSCGSGAYQEMYKDRCGEYHSASGFGFARAVDLVQAGAKGVLMYTLSARGSKAMCVIRP